MSIFKPKYLSYEDVKKRLEKAKKPKELTVKNATMTQAEIRKLETFGEYNVQLVYGSPDSVVFTRKKKRDVV